MKLLFTLLLLLGADFFQSLGTDQRLSQYLIEGQAQGTTYTIQYYSKKQRIEKQHVEHLLREIDASMSLYQDSSLISLFNLPNCSCIMMDRHLREVMQASFRFNEVAGGVFDPTVKPLMDIWGFGRLRTTNAPSASAIDSVLAYVGMHQLRMDGNKLCKANGLVQIDLNGIAQGYTVDALARLLEQAGIKDYLVELGGEIRTKGSKPDNSRFRIGVFVPDSPSSSLGKTIQIKDRAVTTSGSYENVREFSTGAVSHHLDPKSGYPIENQSLSVTVVAKTAMEADGWDNVFITLSPKVAISLANQLKKIDIYVIYSEDGELKSAYSKGFKRYFNSSK